MRGYSEIYFREIYASGLLFACLLISVQRCSESEYFLNIFNELQTLKIFTTSSSLYSQIPGRKVFVNNMNEEQPPKTSFIKSKVCQVVGQCDFVPILQNFRRHQLQYETERRKKEFFGDLLEIRLSRAEKSG